MKLKAWFVYEGSRDWLTCSMLLENGLVLFSHVCSHPGFASGDLYLHRPERQKMITDAGIELDLQGTVHADDIPPEVLVRNQDKEAMENLYAQLFTPKPTPEEIPAPSTEERFRTIQESCNHYRVPA